MQFDQVTNLVSPTGANLGLRANLAANPLGVVQINHGLAEHCGRYRAFAEFLTARNYHVYAHDHRGHGQTIAPDAPPGRFAKSEGVEKLIEDAASVTDLIRARHSGLPIILFGHSMGGLIVLNLLMKHGGDYAGAAIWNANFQAGISGKLARAILRWEQFRLGSDMQSHILPKLTFRAWGKSIPQARTDFDWLSHDPAQVQAYIDDPLCGFSPTISMWRDVFRLIFNGADDRNLEAIPKRMAFNLVGGSNDPATENGAAVKKLEQRLSQSGFLNLKSRIYDGFRHETLNELNHDMIMHEFADWVDQQIPAS